MLNVIILISISILIAGADDDILNFDYQSPIDLATSKNFDDISDLIYNYDFQDSGVSLSPTSSDEAIDDSDIDVDWDITESNNPYDHRLQYSINEGNSNEKGLILLLSLSLLLLLLLLLLST